MSVYLSENDCQWEWCETLGKKIKIRFWHVAINNELSWHSDFFLFAERFQFVKMQERSNQLNKTKIKAVIADCLMPTMYVCVCVCVFARPCPHIRHPKLIFFQSHTQFIPIRQTNMCICSCLSICSAKIIFEMNAELTIYIPITRHMYNIRIKINRSRWSSKANCIKYHEK